VQKYIRPNTRSRWEGRRSPSGCSDSASRAEGKREGEGGLCTAHQVLSKAGVLVDHADAADRAAVAAGISGKDELTHRHYTSSPLKKWLSSIEIKPARGLLRRL
jgi:hypothetical protein